MVRLGLMVSAIALVGACAVDRSGLGATGRGEDGAPPVRDGGDGGPPVEDGGHDAGSPDTGPECPPPAVEVCGGGDEDCDGTVDEGCDCAPGETRACGETAGACEAGEQTCGDDGTWGDCAGAVGPSAEQCDAAMVDEDCDGTPNEDCACAEGETRACGETAGACEAGEQTCGGDGTWGDCTGAVGPSAEQCDAAMVDEDCDGSGNEGCACAEGDTRACTVGACSGTQTCDLAGAWGDCTDLATSMEICNGVDDDCNGTVDDGSADCEGETGCTLLRDGGSVYLLCSDSDAGWADARAACPEGYDLVVINDMDEQDFVQTETSAQSEGEWWIGLWDEDGNGEYEDDEWTAGTSSYRNWDTDNPDHDTQCAMLVNDAGGTWDDKGCGGSRHYVCETL